MDGTSVALPVSMRVISIVLGVLLTGCIGGTAMETSGGSPIINGTRADDDPAVGRVAIGNYSCSGTLVAENVVLSAKHCFKRGTRPSKVKFFTGPLGDQEAAGVVAFTYPGKLDGRVRARDIIALTLDQDLFITPVTVRTEPMTADDVGTAVRLVGYGVTDPNADEDPLRRQGETEIAEVRTNDFTTEGDSSNCFGDSGGPVFDGDVLVGVISATPTRDQCGRRGYHTRVDKNLSLIDRAKAKARNGTTLAEADLDESDDTETDGVVTSGGGDDSCEWANDGECDEPEYCDPGTDVTDCSQGSEPIDAADDDAADGDADADSGADGAATDDSVEAACAEDYCIAGDTFCDEDLDCCDFDADCAAPSCQCDAECDDYGDCCDDC